MATAIRIDTRPLTRGDLVLVNFPYSDLASLKRRPSVIIHATLSQTDFALAFISSQSVATVAQEEISLLPSHSEFSLTGLSAPSKIRASKLATLHRSLITRRLGRLGTQYLYDLDCCLIAALRIDIAPFREEARQNERDRLITLYNQTGIHGVRSDLGL